MLMIHPIRLLKTFITGLKFKANKPYIYSLKTLMLGSAEGNDD